MHSAFCNRVVPEKKIQQTKTNFIKFMWNLKKNAGDLQCTMPPWLCSLHGLLTYFTKFCWPMWSKKYHLKFIPIFGPELVLPPPPTHTHPHLHVRFILIWFQLSSLVLMITVLQRITIQNWHNTNYTCSSLYLIVMQVLLYW